MLVFKSVVVQYSGKIVGLLVSLVSLGLLTRYLGVSAYGQYATVIAIAGTVVTLSDFGFFWSTIHHLNDQTDRLRVLKEIAALKFLLTAGLLIAGGLFVEFGH
ncbi:MAG: oligosaccharide flippase family protein, partial [Patescibacteria group bacterium]